MLYKLKRVSLFWFRIIFPDMYYIFSTNTEEDKQFWLDSIQEQIDENKKGKNGAMNVKTL